MFALLSLSDQSHLVPILGSIQTNHTCSTRALIGFSLTRLQQSSVLTAVRQFHASHMLPSLCCISRISTNIHITACRQRAVGDLAGKFDHSRIANEVVAEDPTPTHITPHAGIADVTGASSCDQTPHPPTSPPLADCGALRHVCHHSFRSLPPYVDSGYKHVILTQKTCRKSLHKRVASASKESPYRVSLGTCPATLPVVGLDDHELSTRLAQVEGFEHLELKSFHVKRKHIKPHRS